MSTLGALYATVFEIRAKELISYGYSDTTSTVTSSTAEEVITDLIVRAIRIRHSNGNLPDPLLRMSVYDDVKVPHSTRFGKARKRIDIQVESHWEPRPLYSFETKCLRKHSHTIGDYFGSDGLMCFIDEHYAVDQDRASMLGYVQSDDLTYWSSELQRKFSMNNPPFNPTSLLRVCKPSFFPSEHKSTHKRISGSLIEISHILLDYT